MGYDSYFPIIEYKQNTRVIMTVFYRPDERGEAVKIAFIVGSWESHPEQLGMLTTS